LYILMPALARVGNDPWLRRWLARGDRLQTCAPGREAALGERFQFPGTRLPVAALLRQHARGDAGQDVWLCADPSWVQVETNGARLMACGNLALDADEAAALARELRPLFGDFGALIETTSPQRWQLRLPQGAKPPAFDTPEQTLGDDLLPHLPQGDAGRRWRALFNEAQMILHGHPVNAARRNRGQVPVNALWFWGEGSLPWWVQSKLSAACSDDALLRALAAAAKVAVHPPAAFAADGKGSGDVLLDLADAEDVASWWPPVQAQWRRHDEIVLAFAGGEHYRLKRWHRWRFWRRTR
jgi:hypothetical protein